MQKRKVSRAFELEAVRLVMDRRVPVLQTAQTRAAICEIAATIIPLARMAMEN